VNGAVSLSDLRRFPLPLFSDSFPCFPARLPLPDGDHRGSPAQHNTTGPSRTPASAETKHRLVAVWFFGVVVFFLVWTPSRLFFAAGSGATPHGRSLFSLRVDSRRFLAHVDRPEPESTPPCFSFRFGGRERGAHSNDVSLERVVPRRRCVGVCFFCVLRCPDPCFLNASSPLSSRRHEVTDPT